MHFPLGLSFALGLMTGSTLPDARLSSYQWDTRPQMAWGAQALAGTSRFSGGLRVWSTGTTQNLGLPEQPTAHVRTTSYDLVGRGVVARGLGFDLLALGSVGRMHMSYQPGHVTTDVGGVPTVITLAPIEEWSGGGGLAVEHRVAGTWSVGAAVERRLFGLDTAHTSGGSVVEGRESFGDWTARVEIARIFVR
jgi:hypothetical protein